MARIEVTNLDRWVASFLRGRRYEFRIVFGRDRENQVIDSRDPIVIWRRGREPVALIAAGELAGWMETGYLLRSPKNARRLLEAGERAARGGGEPRDVDRLSRRLGIGEGE